MVSPNGTRPASESALDEILLSGHTRASFGAAILKALEQEHGEAAGIVLTDPTWGLAKKGRSGATTFPVGTLGTIAVSHDRDAARFAQRLAVMLADFEALEIERERSIRLASLYEAAHEFSFHLDLDQALETIVQRSKELTGADVCYLSLNDFERRETYFCTTVGTHTEAFRHIRLPFGHGLGGLVVQTAKPYYSPDYLHDPNFVHVVDPLVEAEGIVSLIGVPLKLGERVTGVLFVANRYLSAFGQEDVAFLESLADHAAIAIENARLYGRLERTQRLHRALTDLVASEQPLEALEREIGNALGIPVRVIEPGDPMPDDVGTEIRAGPTLLGWLGAEATSLNDEQRVALEQAARVVALHFMKERAVLEAALRSRSDLLEAIVTGTASPSELTRRAAIFGLDLRRPHRAVVLPGVEERDIARMNAGAFVATRQGHTVMVIAEDTPIREAPLAAMGPAGVGPEALARSIAEATRVMEVARLLKLTGTVGAEELGVYSLLLAPQRSHGVLAHARSLLRPLLDRGEEDNMLLETLETFLDCQGRPAAAARHLYIHVNSFYYRLSRLKEVTGWDLDDPELRLQLHIACRILRLREVLGDATGAPAPSGDAG